MSNQATLILNSDYSPIQIVSWQRAVILMLDNAVLLVKPYIDRDGKEVMICSPSIEVPKPAIVICRKYKNTRRKRVTLSKQNIYLRDDFTCQYTGARLGKEEVNIDHITPKSKGGKSTWENLVTCSKRVNVLKGDRTPKDAGLSLIQAPCRPHWSRILLKKLKYSNNAIWQNFLEEYGYL